jgi:P4 family phage/plasmid primase-like protien
VRVSVWPHEAVTGWEGPQSTCDKFPVLELDEALRRAWNTDAHFVPYSVRLADGSRPDAIPRLNLPGFSALERQGHAVVYGALVYDLDDPIAHDKRRPDVVEARPIWREDLDDTIADLPLELRPSVVYGTKRGARMIYALAAELTSGEAYKRTWAGLRERLAAEGVDVDDLRDANRCYRLPNVIRDGSRRTHGRTVIDFSRRLSGAFVEALAPSAPAVDGDAPRVFAGIGAAVAPLSLTGEITSNRNVTLTRVGGKLRAMGMAEPEILETLRTVARTRAPGWTPEAGELEHIARSVSRYQAAPLDQAVAPASAVAAAKGVSLVEGDLRFVLASEAELARAAASDLEAGGPELAFDRGTLHGYDKARGIWAPIEDATVRAHVASWDGEWVGTGKRKADDSLVVMPLRVSSALTSGVLDLVRVYRARSGFFDEAGDGLTFSNGYVRATPSGVVLEAVDPSQRSTAALAWSYRRGATPAQFVGALRACWQGEDDVEERIAFFRQFIGAALLGIATRYQVGVVLTGDGANGKSTILDIVSALFGSELVTAIPPQDLAQEYRRAMLARARINVVSELPETEILESVAVKAVLTGDSITAREIREAPFRFRPRAAHLFAANELPGVRDMSHGFWRRWAILTFSREFSGSEADTGIGQRIIDSELEAIASWAVDGAAELMARGRYQIPSSSVEAVHEWRHSADVVTRFLEDRTTETDLARTQLSDLYGAFSQWCQTNGHKNALSSNKFARRLKNAGVRSERKSAGVFYSRALRLFSVPDCRIEKAHVGSERDPTWP